MFKRLLSVFLLSGFGYVAQAQNPQPDPISTVNEPSADLAFINISEFNFARGVYFNNRDQAIGLSTINGYLLNDKISFGIGVGVEKYLPKGNEYGGANRELILAPVFSDVRLFLGRGKVQPFLGQAVGYAFKLKQTENYGYYGKYKEKGGLMVNPFLGFRTNFDTRVNYSFSLGYRYQVNNQVVTEINRQLIYSPSSQIKMSRIDQYLTLKFGLTF